LFEVDVYVTADDPRLAAFADRVGGNARVSAAGSYARPFSRP